MHPTNAADSSSVFEFSQVDSLYFLCFLKSLSSLEEEAAIIILSTRN